MVILADDVSRLLGMTYALAPGYYKRRLRWLLCYIAYAYTVPEKWWRLAGALLEVAGVALDAGEYRLFYEILSLLQRMASGEPIDYNSFLGSVWRDRRYRCCIAGVGCFNCKGAYC